jgi:hypothetical protein
MGKMASHIMGSGYTGGDFSFFGPIGFCKQILNQVADRAWAAADVSRFAALPARYLDDVDLTAADRVKALGYEEPMLDGWRIVASHL